MADDGMKEDVKTLLDGDFGDDRILKEIYRACKNGEVISNYERSYVCDLAERYLKRDIAGDAAPEGGGHDPVAPDVILPGMQQHAQSGPDARDGTVASADTKTAATAATATAATAAASDDGSVKFISSRTKKARRPLKVIVAVLAVVLILGLAAGALVGPSSDDLPEPGGTPGIAPVLPVEDGFFVRTDLGSYSAGEFIQVAGVSDTRESITISVINPSGSAAWVEAVHVKSDGTYSTVIIAGGGGGWADSGAFTISAEDADGNVASSEFVMVP